MSSQHFRDFFPAQKTINKDGPNFHNLKIFLKCLKSIPSAMGDRSENE